MQNNMPPQFCNNSYTDYACPINATCEAGCNCIKDYLRNFEGICVFNEKCPPPPLIPPCGDNEVGSLCKISCPPDTCDFDPKTQACKPGPCQPGCNCIENYLRDSNGKCIPKKQCPKKTCTIPNKCRPTCAEPSPPNCSAYPPVTENVPGCKCKPGSILLERNGECVKIEDCPQQLGCNKDPNARVTKCPAPCPSTCQSPNEVPCKKACLDVGCECTEGYILSKLSGKCISPNECPGGNPCGTNATLSSCRNRCPYDYCPVDDSRPDYSCSSPNPCPSGCVCRLNYRRKSINEEGCILASECPPVNCTRPNEVWSPCPSDCLGEDCEDSDRGPVICNTLVLNCQPKCICKPNTFRDKNKICIPVDQCPKKNPQPECDNGYLDDTFFK